MKNKLKGVTLVETMLYIGIFSIFIFTIINFMLSTQEATSNNNEKNKLNATTEYLSQHFSDSFEKELSVNEELSVFNTDNGVLLLTFLNGENQYTLSNSTIYFNGIAITPPEQLVTQFRLEPMYKSTDKLVGMRISLVIQSKKTPNLTENLNIIKVVR